MGIYGTTVGASDVAEALKNETAWQNLYNQIPNYATDVMGENLSRYLSTENDRITKELQDTIMSIQDLGAKSIHNLGIDFSKDLMGGYKSIAKQRSSILESNLGIGYKENLTDDLNDSLNAAYDSYISKYKQDKFSIESEVDDAISKAQSSAENMRSQLSTYATNQRKWIDSLVQARSESIEEVDKALLEESKNYEAFYNSIMDYADWLFGEDSEVDSSAWDKGEWKKYFFDGDRYIGSAALSDKMYDYNGDGTYTLNDDGRNILNMLMSDGLATQPLDDGSLLTGYGYDTYIAKENEELAKWLMSTSAYATEDDFNNEWFQNKNYALSMLGINKLDYTYQGESSNSNDYTPGNYDKQEIAYNDNNLDKPAIKIDSDGNTNYYRNAKVGTVAVYGNANNTIVAFDEFSFGADKNINNKDGESFTVKFKDDSGNTHKYKLELVNEDEGKDVVITSDNKIYSEIKSAVKHIVPNKIYAYGSKLYAAVNTESGIILRKLQGSGHGDSYKELEDIVTGNVNKSDWGRQYTAYDIQSGRVHTTKTDDEILNDAKMRGLKVGADVRNKAHKKYMNDYSMYELSKAKGYTLNIPDEWLKRYKDPNYRWDDEYGRWRYKGELITD